MLPTVARWVSINGPFAPACWIADVGRERMRVIAGLNVVLGVIAVLVAYGRFVVAPF
jgi:hypothetical protein